RGRQGVRLLARVPPGDGEVFDGAGWIAGELVVLGHRRADDLQDREPAVRGDRRESDERPLLALANRGHLVSDPVGDLIAPGDKVGVAELVNAEAAEGRDETGQRVRPALPTLRGLELALSHLRLEQRCGVFAP